MKKILLVLSLFLISNYSFAELIPNNELKAEFQYHPDYKKIKKLNKSISTKDLAFCNFNLEDNICLIAVENEKYAIDVLGLEVKGISNDENNEQLKLKELNNHEFTLLLFYIEKVRLELQNVAITSSNNFIKPKSSTKEKLSFLNSTAPNGCGTPSHWSYPWIPDKPFKSACNNHDVCYGTYTNKSVCDDEFLRQMKLIAKQQAIDISMDFPISEGAVQALLNGLAETYYIAVSELDTALDAYCAGKGTLCTSLLGELNVVDGTSPISGSGDGGNGQIFPNSLYNEDNVCIMPIYYMTCAYNQCKRNVITLPCP